MAAYFAENPAGGVVIRIGLLVFIEDVERGLRVDCVVDAGCFNGTTLSIHLE
ncbi:hypothetical protein HanRHA438_Chr01g0029061 [Helianthus annuus]|nr:hypothetical protein HanRHA438_Chr01g0029061 [Helianthus annuus]